MHANQNPIIMKKPVWKIYAPAIIRIVIMQPFISSHHQPILILAKPSPYGDIYIPFLFSNPPTVPLPLFSFDFENQEQKIMFIGGGGIPRETLGGPLLVTFTWEQHHTSSVANLFESQWYPKETPGTCYDANQTFGDSWDEWVENDRLLEFNEENVEKQKVLEKNLGAEKNQKSGRSGLSKPKGSQEAKWEKEDPKNNSIRGKKRKGQTGAEEDMKPSERLTMIQLPLTLKKQLVDDWEFVAQLGKLVKLPRNPSVDDILKKYLDYRTKKDGMIADSVGEILKGIRCYFDKALLAMLLYKNERAQYHEAVGDKVSPSTIYGAEHLLRLFVKLPELLAYVNMEEEALAKLQQKLSDFLKFLQKNQSSFFLSSYDGSRSH